MFLLASVVCPLPGSVSHEAALAKLREVQQRRKSLSPAAQERFAARELGIDVPTFRAALRQKPLPTPVPVPRPVPVVPKPVLDSTTKLATTDDVAKAAQKKLDEVITRRASLSRAAQERLAAKEMGMDIKEFRSALRGSPVELHTYVEPKHLRGLRKLPEPGHRDGMIGSNPAFDRFEQETFINCAKVVNAYELRRRGYDVIASVGSAHMNTYQLRALWKNTKTGAQPRLMARSKIWDIEDLMEDDPVGARYQVVVIWPGETSSHIFSAEKMANGRISYYDAQVMNPDVRHYFSEASTNRDIYAWRVDDAEPGEGIIDLLEKRGQH